MAAGRTDGLVLVAVQELHEDGEAVVVGAGQPDDENGLARRTRAAFGKGVVAIEDAEVAGGRGTVAKSTFAGGCGPKRTDAGN